MIDLSFFTVDPQATIKDALKSIDQNKNRCVFVKNETGRIIGMVTDGDIRRFLMTGAETSAPVSKCMNQSFVSATTEASREYVLKLLDQRVNVVPILDKDGCLVNVISSKEFPLVKERDVLVRARSPVRISFGGGGTDLTHYFVKNQVGVVVNATIKMYSHATLKKRSDHKMMIESFDVNDSVCVDELSQLANHPNFALIHSLLNLIKPNYGFELSLSSDFPIGSGLGGSSVVLSAIIGCFNQFREDPWDRHEIAELAFQAERIFLKMQGGWQDQYATVFGGFNFIEFKESENIVHPLKMAKETILELEENLVLCNSQETHQSFSIHEDQKKQFEKSEQIQDLFHKHRDLCYQMKSYLLRGNMEQFGKSLDEAWQLKRNFSSGVSTQRIDQIYNLGKQSGAYGGKLLGAGGGGFMLFYVPPESKRKLIQSLKEFGVNTMPVHFDDDGLQVWKVRL